MYTRFVVVQRGHRRVISNVVSCFHLRACSSTKVTFHTSNIHGRNSKYEQQNQLELEGELSFSFFSPFARIRHHTNSFNFLFCQHFCKLFHIGQTMQMIHCPDTDQWYYCPLPYSSHPCHDYVMLTRILMISSN